MSGMKIILFGYRGSGKTTVGKIIAEKLSLPLVDTDLEIVERFGGMTIAEIWQKHGEPAFREMECQVTQDFCGQRSQTENCVISLGGGTLMQKAAFAAVEACEDAIRIYLAAPAEVLSQRIAGDVHTQKNRPSLTAAQSAIDEVKQVLVEREPTYLKAADHVVDVSAASVDEIATQIIQFVNDQFAL